jgi:hypothetical protein
MRGMAIRGATVNELALVLARREGLLDEDTGEIRCWRCKRPGALLPTLRCRACTGLPAIPPRTSAPATVASALSTGQSVPREDRWIAAADRLRDDAALTNERALHLLERARRAPDATAAKVRQLEHLYAKRFTPELPFAATDAERGAKR